ncbi:hypothetical protein M514_26559 [Trichuris suis]|uniref:Uncharacterized protein n=1 Tax=Trichuris suis TaxID=68888 RepID=A0A085MVL5_9BILA|nr:hypothetical protein M514_26559 [Trichuris suis]
MLLHRNPRSPLNKSNPSTFWARRIYQRRPYAAEVSVSDKSYCGLYGTRRDGSEVMVVECQFAAELTHRGKEIAALCYQNTTTGGRGSRGEAFAGEMCKKWSYPGTELPQLQLPGYLRSRDSDVLWYDPANLESFDGNVSVDSDSCTHALCWALQLTIQRVEKSVLPVGSSTNMRGLDFLEKEN